jgi:hypothetical protein
MEACASVPFRWPAPAAAQWSPCCFSRRDAPGGRAPFLAFYAAFPTRAFAAAARQLQPAGRNFRVARWDVNSSKRGCENSREPLLNCPAAAAPAAAAAIARQQRYRS